MYKVILVTIILALSSWGCSVSSKLSRCFGPPPEDTQHIFLSQMSERNSQFKSDTVHFVDYHTKTGNYIFRGNMPLINNSFAYDQLMNTIRNIVKNKLHRTLPSDTFLIDISLINPVIEEQDLKRESLFFKQNPDKGILINHPIYGALTSPNSYPEELRKELEQIPSLGHLSRLVENINELIDTKNSKAQIIYVHCEAGHDRTGEVIAAYQMRYAQISYECAYSNANKIAGRLISGYSQSGLQWYAYYLKDIKNIKTIGDIY